MKKRKLLFDLIPLMILWLMLSVFLWGWIFTFLTNTKAENKIVLFVDAALTETTALALRMEEYGAEGIEMVKVYPFTYAMMDDMELSAADLYIVPASAAEAYQVWFRPLPERFAGQGETLTLENGSSGVRVYDAKTGQGPAEAYIEYQAEDYYLFFGQKSVHVKENAGAADDLAIDYALHLLSVE